MGYYADAVDSLLTGEWKSTKEIAFKISNDYAMPETHLRYVYRHLTKMVRWGIAEK